VKVGGTGVAVEKGVGDVSRVLTRTIVGCGSEADREITSLPERSWLS
jgi:hypothetical protein